MQNIENELKERLQKGVYGDIYNVPFKKFEDLVGVNEEPEEEEEEQGMVLNKLQAQFVATYLLSVPALSFVFT